MPIINNDQMSVYKFEGDWCTSTALVVIFDKNEMSYTGQIPKGQETLLKSLLQFECPEAQQIKVTYPYSEPLAVADGHSVFMPGAFNLINLGGDLRYKDDQTGEFKYWKPEWFLLERTDMSYKVIDAREPTCRGELIRMDPDSLPEPDWGMGLVNGRSYNYFKEEYPRPVERDAYKLPESCPRVYILIEPEELMSYRERRRPGWKLAAQLLFQHKNLNGGFTHVNRPARIEVLEASEPDEAIKLGRDQAEKLMRYTDSRYVDEIFANPDDMQLVEYRDWIGQKPTKYFSFVDIFGFGWFRVIRGSDKERVVKRAGTEHSDVRRVGEAIVFDSFEDGKKVLTTVIAPYPYGETAGGALVGALFGFSANDFITSDYFMRQVFTCEERKMWGSNIKFIDYSGPYRLAETLNGTCDFQRAGDIKGIFAHLQSGGQAGNSDRQSILTNMMGGGTVTIMNYPCSNRPEFRIQNYVMQLRSAEGPQGCDTPSQNPSVLRSPFARHPVDPQIIYPQN